MKGLLITLAVIGVVLILTGIFAAIVISAMPLAGKIFMIGLVLLVCSLIGAFIYTESQSDGYY